MKYSDDEILKIVKAEIDQATGGDKDVIESNRQAAYAAYLGDKGTTQEGRSSVVSTDVADAIEWIMPEVMKAFTQNNEVVTFDPVGPNDRQQAELESRFVYDVLMKDNNGFITLHTFFKDALLQKNGIVKVFYEDESKVEYLSYSGLTDPEMQMLMADPHNEIVGMTSVIKDNIQVTDVNVKRTIIGGRINVIPVAPENFRVNKRHNCVDLQHARFCSDTTIMTRAELLARGYEIEQKTDRPDTTGTADDYDVDRHYRFSMQGESIAGGNDSTTVEGSLYDVTECYMHLDMDDKGTSRLYKITVLGYDNPTQLLDIEPVHCNPYVSATAILMGHKFYGLSVYDRLKEIQQAKTALWRNILDNIYLQNNQRTIVQEGMVNLDDLLISRPGGIIRSKSPNAVQPFPTTPLSSDVYRMMDYYDQVRSGRVGVSPDGSIHDSAMGDSVGSQGLSDLLNQKEELVGLMIRVFAETGVKPICCKIRDLLIRHRDVVEDYEFRGAWTQVNPSSWVARKRTSIRVGTGSGNRKEQVAALGQIIAFQKEAIAQPGQALVTEANLFASLNDFAKASGLPGAAPYFLDPASPEGQQNKQQVDAAGQQQQQQEIQEKQLLATTQMKLAEAETTKAQSMVQSVQVRAENENLKNQLAAMQSQHDFEMNALKHELEQAKLGVKDDHHAQDLQFKYYQNDTSQALQREIAGLKQQESDNAE